MARRTPTEKLEEIERVVRSHPVGLSAQEIAQAISDRTSDRTLQNHLNRLVKDGRVVRRSSGRWARYRPPAADVVTAEAEPAIPLGRRCRHSAGGETSPVRAYTCRLSARVPGRLPPEPDLLPDRGTTIAAGSRHEPPNRSVAGWYLCANHPEPAADRPGLELEPPRRQYLLAARHTTPDRVRPAGRGT